MSYSDWTDGEVIDVLASAAAGLLEELGGDAVFLGDGGYLFGYERGCIHVDGEPIVSGVTACDIKFDAHEEE